MVNVFQSLLVTEQGSPSVYCIHISSFMLILGNCGQHGISGSDLNMISQATSAFVCGRLPIAVAEKLPLKLLVIDYHLPFYMAAFGSDFLCRARWYFAHNEAPLRSTTLKFQDVKSLLTE